MFGGSSGSRDYAPVIQFKANGSNSIYGSSTTLQIPSNYILIIIKAWIEDTWTVTAKP